MPELTTYQHVYRKEEHCKIITVFALTLTLGALSLSQGPCERGSTSNTAKKEEKKKEKKGKRKKGGKSSIMFTGHTAFLRIKLFCKEKLFIERSHLSNYSVCNNH